MEEIEIEYDLIMKGAMEIKCKINTIFLSLEYKYYYFITIQLEKIANHCGYFLRTMENESVNLEVKK